MLPEWIPESMKFIKEVFFSSALYATVIIAFGVASLHHPMLRHVNDKDWGKNIADNNVFTNTYMTYRTPAFKHKMEKFNQSDSVDMVHHYEGKNTLTLEVYKYIEDYVVAEKESDFSTRLVSPIHIIMILLGCYGDRWNDPGLQDVLKQQFMKQTVDDKEHFLANFMLQALDSSNGVKFDTHDRSTCSCLRDFAVPFELPVATKKDCDSRQHDSCSLKNLAEYADATSEQLDKTIIDEIQTFEMKSAVAAQMSTKLFTGEYAYNAKFTGAYVINSNLKKIPELENFMTFVEYYCKYAVEDTYCNKANTTLAQALTVMKQWPAKMYAYNKLRQPRFPGLSPQHIIDAQKAYRSKYKAAFQTCVFAGVPHTTTTLVGVTNKVHWIVSGELILLLASTCLFAWGTYIQNLCDETQQMTFSKLKYVRSIGLALLILFALVMLIVHLRSWGQNGNDMFKVPYTDDDNNVFKSLGLFAIYTPIFVIWFILMSFAILCAVLVIVYTTILYTTHGFYAKVPSTPDQPPDNLSAYSVQISLDLPVIIGLSVTAVGITLQRGAADHSVIVAVIVLFTTIGLVSHITNVLHMIHLQAQGLEAQAKTHITATQTTEKPMEDVHKKNMRSLIFNRVLIALVIAVLLLIFLYLAGLDSAQPDFDTGNSARFASLYRFGVQEQYIFAIVVFVILVFGDLSLELKGVFFQTMYIDPNHYMYQSLANKYTHTAWIIIVGLIILNYHALQNLCARDGKLLTNGQLEDEDYCKLFGLY
jgi:hypothetical protein